MFFYLYLMKLFSVDTTISLILFLFFSPKNIKKLPSKVAHNNVLGQQVLSPASFCFVPLRKFYSLRFSHL